MEVLKLENLSKYYTSENSVVVGLTGINLSFSTGEFVALTGESGSGKSTLAHVLGGIIPYESGELYIYGQPTSHYDADDWSKYRRDLISFISQSYGILPGNTVAENVESALRLSGLSTEEAAERTKAILDEVELSEFKNRKAGKLSSGQKQRLSIARALAKPSKILIADEPTGNLDRENSEKVIALLKRASRDRLVILITHEFDEAKDLATRRIILSDGAVVTDAELAPRYINSGKDNVEKSVSETERKKSPSKKGAKTHKPLPPYICALTLKSRPVFSVLLCLLLCITTLITFIFLGTFISWLDDSPTRIYDRSAFYNGDPRRIVVMKADGSSMTEADYIDLLSKRYVEDIERFGYVNDYIYHYKDGVDHSQNRVLTFGPNYHPITNPDDYKLEGYINFFEDNLNFVRTLPYTDRDIITEGRAPEGVYEILSADPDLNVGDTVTVYIRNLANWGIDSYIDIDFEVVGKTEYGEGLYFSDKFAATLSQPKKLELPFPPYTSYASDFIFLPYSADGLKFDFSSVSLTDNDFVLMLANDAIKIDKGTKVSVLLGDTRLMLTCLSKMDSDGISVVMVNDKNFDAVTDLSCANQVSLYIEDYSYSERVIDSLTSSGYVAISPYKLGSTEIDKELADERMATLAICAAVFVISFILQVILLRSMFASLHEYYRLMSNTGLTEKIANTALSMMLLILTLAGEILGAAVILSLNAVGFDRVADIFKYFDIGMIFMLFGVHFVSVAISLIGILRGLKKTVFGKGKSNYDIDFSLMEDSAL